MPTMNDINLNRVAVFARVVEAGGFTPAARTLGVPKSSASRSVRQLEEALGVRLLQRTTRRLRLTSAGQAYYERVASALAGLEEARAAAAEAQDTPRGLVRLATPTEWGSWLIAPVVAEFVGRYPEIRIDVSFTSRDVDLVREGFDLALRVGRLKDSSLIVRTVGTVAGGLFASERYVARRGAPETPEALASQRQRIRQRRRTCRDGRSGLRLRGRTARDGHWPAAGLGMRVAPRPRTGPSRVRQAGADALGGLSLVSLRAASRRALPRCARRALAGAARKPASDEARGL
jgi:DNA-binding transcriptional LysR family regulator